MRLSFNYCSILLVAFFLEIASPVSSFARPYLLTSISTGPGLFEIVIPLVPVELSVAFSKLDLNDSIPKELYEKYDSSTLAKAIVEWVRNREMKQRFNGENHVPIDLFQETQIMLHFQPKDAPSIRKSGYLNQHQIGKSKGAYHVENRRKAEDVFTGLALGRNGQSALSLRPKSSLLIIDANISLGRYDHPVSSHYGEAVAVLRNEVKYRSLWTAGDSLTIGSMLIPDEEALNLNRGSLFRGYFPEKKAVNPPYIEAVVYGPITFDDIDHFLLFEEKDTETFAPYGKPIFLAEATCKNNRTFNKYIKLLYLGCSIPKSVPPSQWEQFSALFSDQSTAIEEAPQQTPTFGRCQNTTLIKAKL